MACSAVCGVIALVIGLAWGFCAGVAFTKRAKP